MNYNTPLVFLFFLTGRRPHHHTTTMPMPMRIFISSCTRTSTCTVQCLHHPSTAGRSSTYTRTRLRSGSSRECCVHVRHPQSRRVTQPTMHTPRPTRRPTGHRPATQRRRGTTTQTLVHGQRRNDDGGQQPRHSSTANDDGI